MSEIHQQILALQEQRRLCEDQVKRRDALIKLSNIPEFKLIIRDQFMVTDCARFVEQSVNPALEPANQADALAKAQAAGHLKQYLSVIVLQGNSSERDLLSIDAEIEELRGLGADEDTEEDA